jgi:acetyl-CoA C-acetyltransferase
MNAGIKDQVAVVGMGCTRFGARYDAAMEDLIIEAVQECLTDANLTLDDIDAYWFGTAVSTSSGLGLSSALRLQDKPVTRIENLCGTGTDAFRNACYAVACGAYDVVMAVGMEKLNDNGYSGLVFQQQDIDNTHPEMSAPSVFALLCPGYATKYNVGFEDLRKAMMTVAYKNHYNGSLNEKATFRKVVSMEEIAKSPMIAPPYMTVMDCSGVSDGSACAIIMRSDMARKHRKDPMYVKALNFTADNGRNRTHSAYDFTSVAGTVKCSAELYRQAGITNPAEELSIVEFHDCFTITELCLYEDLGLSERGQGWRDVLEGKFNRDGKLPVNIDGGLKSFGHPIGATGLRMLYENWLQFHGRAGKRQLENPRLGLTHNLGGEPYCCINAMTIVGSELG